MRRRPDRLERILELQAVVGAAEWIEPFFRKRIGRILEDMRQQYHLQPATVADSLRQSNHLLQLSDQLMRVMQQALGQRRSNDAAPDEADLALEPDVPEPANRGEPPP